MASKQPAILFYVGDWKKDPAVTLCSPATRGIWFDLLLSMHELGHRGQVAGTPEQLSRTSRCTPAEMRLAIEELASTGAAEISERNGIVTVVNRRMKREWEQRVASTERVKKHRCNASVTAFPEDEDEKENENENENKEGCAKGGEISRAADAANRWCYLLARKKFRGPKDSPYDVKDEFQAWLDAGLAYEKLISEIERSDRDRSEFTWEMKLRLMPSRNATKGSSVTESAIEEAVRKDEELMARLKAGER